MPETRGPTRRDAFQVAGLHLVVALYYWLGRGVTIVHDYGPDPWSWFWQNVPSDLLRDRALQSLWHLHAQPPLWNVVGALLIKVFGGAHLQALQALNIVLGAATAALCLLLVARLTGSRRWSVGCGLVVALHPALFLYEAYALYTTLVAFGVVAAAYLLERAREPRSTAAALGFVAMVAGLVLTRSLFHLVLLAAAVPMVVALTGRLTRRQLAVLFLLMGIPMGWYGKNAVQHGFFGGSSWYGMGLWRSALFGQERGRLDQLRSRGLLEPVAALTPFSPPSEYRALGFDRESDVPVLARDNQHNVNVPDISRAYARSAKALIVRTPLRYLRNVITGYGNFCAPSSDFAHLEPNRDRMRLHADLSRLLLLRPAIGAAERLLGTGYVGTVYFVLIPLVVLAALAPVVRVRSVGDLARLVRTDAAPLFLAGIVAYTALVGSAMELGENARFKFMVEPALLVLLTIVAQRAVAARQGASQDATDGGPPDGP